MIFSTIANIVTRAFESEEPELEPELESEEPELEPKPEPTPEEAAAARSAQCEAARAQARAAVEAAREAHRTEELAVNAARSESDAVAAVVEKPCSIAPLPSEIAARREHRERGLATRVAASRAAKTCNEKYSALKAAEAALKTAEADHDAAMRLERLPTLAALAAHETYAERTREHFAAILEGERVIRSAAREIEASWRAQHGAAAELRSMGIAAENLGHGQMVGALVDGPIGGAVHQLLATTWGTLENKLLIGFKPLVMARQAHAEALEQEARLALELEPKPDPAAIAEEEAKRRAGWVKEQNRMRASLGQDPLEGGTTPTDPLRAVRGTHNPRY